VKYIDQHVAWEQKWSQSKCHHEPRLSRC